MKSAIIFGTFIAVMTGIAIGAQASMIGRAGSIIGSFRTGMLTNFAGGIWGLLIFIVFLLLPHADNRPITRPAVILMLVSGFIGVFVVIGVAFSMQYAGVAAGLSAIILGQMALSLLIDTTGWGGAAQIPLSISRVMGLLVMALGVYLLLPRG